MTPGASRWSLTEANSPVSLSVRGNALVGRARRRALQGVDEAGGVVDGVDLAVPADGEAGDEDRGVGQLLVPGDLLAVVAQAPDLAVLVVAVDIGPAQLGELRAVVDVAAGDRPALGVVVLDDGGNDRAGPGLLVRVERVAPFLDAPAVVAPLLDHPDHLPEVLADVADPEPPGLGVEAHPPGVAEPEGPDLRPRPGVR